MRVVVKLTIFWLGLVGVVELPGPLCFPNLLPNDFSPLTQGFLYEVFSTIPPLGVDGFGWGYAFLLFEYCPSRGSRCVHTGWGIRSHGLLAASFSGLGSQRLFSALLSRSGCERLLAAVVSRPWCAGLFATNLRWIRSSGSRLLWRARRALSPRRSDWSCVDSSPRWHGNQIQIRRWSMVRGGRLVSGPKIETQIFLGLLGKTPPVLVGHDTNSAVLCNSGF